MAKIKNYLKQLYNNYKKERDGFKQWFTRQPHRIQAEFQDEMDLYEETLSYFEPIATDEHGPVCSWLCSEGAAIRLLKKKIKLSEFVDFRLATGISAEEATGRLIDQYLD